MKALLGDDIRNALDATGVDYRVMACDPALADTASFCEHYRQPLEKSANAILVKSKAAEPRFALCVLLATTRLDVNKSVRHQLGAKRASFASAEETREQTGMEIGGVTPLGLPAHIELLVDQRIAELDFIILGGGSRTAKIFVSPQLFEHLPNASFVAGLAK